MARTRVLVTDFSAGMLSPRLTGRLDTPFRVKGAQHIEGFVLSPDGGLRRRPGSIYVRSSLGVDAPAVGLVEPPAIPAFIPYMKRNGVGQDGGRIGWFTEDAFVMRDMATGAESSVEVASAPAGRHLQTLGRFCATADLATQRLLLWTPEESYLLDMETDAIGSNAEQEIGIVFQNRLIATDRDSGRLYMSVPLERLNFLVDDNNPTGAIEVDPDYYGIEHPRWIQARGSLYIGTQDAEYEIVSSLPYYSNDPGGVIVQRIAQIGTEEAHYFGRHMVMSKGARLIRMDFSGEVNSYVSESMAELIDNADIVTFCALEYGSHRYLFAVDVLARLWCYTDSPDSQVAGWTLYDTDVWWCAAFKQDLYVAKKREDAFWLEVYPLDSLWYPGGRGSAQSLAYQWRRFHGDSGGFLVVDDAAVTADLGPPSDYVDVFRLDETGESVYVGELQTTATGELADTDEAVRSFVGHSAGHGAVYCAFHRTGAQPVSRILTMPLYTATEGGSPLGQVTTCAGVVVHVADSKAMRVRVGGGEWEQWQSGDLYTGPVEFTPAAGYSALGTQIEIESVGAEPLNVYAVQADVITED